MADVVILQERNMTFAQTAEFGALYVSVAETISLTAGEKYTVEWNGTVWSDLTAIYYDSIGSVGIGNAAVLGIGADTEEPFAIGLGDGVTLMFTAENVGTIPVAIYQSVGNEEIDHTEYLIQRATLAAIADAIRAKTGKSDQIPVADMAAEIAGITAAGGSSADVRYVTFMSVDGSVEYGKKAVAVAEQPSTSNEKDRILMYWVLYSRTWPWTPMRTKSHLLQHRKKTKAQTDRRALPKRDASAVSRIFFRFPAPMPWAVRMAVPPQRAVMAELTMW